MEEKKKDWWFISIAIASIIYSLVALVILFINLYYSPPSPQLGLNGIGDYLSGVFSPLAFFWLAYGYWMQRKEMNESLSISNKNLSYNLYMREKEDILKSNGIQPIFEMYDFGILKKEKNSLYLFFRVINKGEEAVRVSITLDKNIITPDRVEKNSCFTVNATLFFDDPINKLDKEYYGTISYLDSDNQYQTRLTTITAFGLPDPHPPIINLTFESPYKEVPKLNGY